MTIRRFEIVSSNTNIQTTPRGALFRRSDGTYIIGRPIDQPKPISPTEVDDGQNTYIYYAMDGSRFKGRSRVIKETRTPAAKRVSASGLEHPAAWAGSYAVWESNAGNWSRSVDKITQPKLDPTSYSAHDFKTWEQKMREKLLK